MSIRNSLTVVVAFCLGIVCSHGQDRPWVFRGKTLPGPVPKVSTVAGGVVIFDRVALRSIDHAATLDTVTGIRGEFCDFVDFAGGITFAVTYDLTERKAWAHYSQGGNSWLTIDSMMNVARPTSLVAAPTEWFMATEVGSTIYRIGETNSTIKGPAPDPIRQMVLIGTTLAVNVAGKQISSTTDFGQSWSTIPLPGVGPLHVLDGTLYAASAQGVKKVDLTAGSVSDVGIWDLKTGTAPATLDLESYLGNLLTIAVDTAYQMFRLDPSNGTWTPLAYPLPCRKAIESPSLLSIEAGWAIAAINVIEGNKDTSGIYAYDLNDFTSVNDGDAAAAHLDNIVLTSQVTEIEMGEGIVSCQLIDLSGRSITCFPASATGRVRFDAAGLVPGAYVLVSHGTRTPRMCRVLIP